MDTTETAQDIHLKQDNPDLASNADEPAEGPDMEEPKA
jgi:hypothetical protein